MQITAEFGSTATMQLRPPSAELRGRILKLRWIGMDDEALELSDRLAESVALDCPLIGPRDTD